MFFLLINYGGLNGNIKTLAMTLQRKAGGLWFSSNGNNTNTTVEQDISGGVLCVKEQAG